MKKHDLPWYRCHIHREMSIIEDHLYMHNLVISVTFVLFFFKLFFFLLSIISKIMHGSVNFMHAS